MYYSLKQKTQNDIILNKTVYLLLPLMCKSRGIRFFPLLYSTHFPSLFPSLLAQTRHNPYLYMPCYHDEEKEGSFALQASLAWLHKGHPNHLILRYDRVRWPSPPAPYNYQGRRDIFERMREQRNKKKNIEKKDQNRREKEGKK